MKRAILVGTGTVAGVAAILALNPDPAVQTASAAASSATSTTSHKATSSGSSSSGSSSSGTSSSGSSGSSSSGSSGSSSSGSSSSGSSSSGSSSSGSSSSGSSSGSSSSSSAKNGTYDGTALDVGRGYGTVQVEITVKDGRIVDVTALRSPSNDPRSQQISSVAIPYLVQQALKAQSADVAGVSGASYTSYGFAKSLADAISQAGL